MEKIHTILFYKYVNIEDASVFRRKHLKFCKNLGIKGRILLASEGINGSVAGTKEQIDIYKEEIRRDTKFSDIIFKEETGICLPFKKMAIKIKKEIVNFGQNIDLCKSGKHISAEDFLDFYKDNENVIILDVRNDYESRVGKFKNAITSEIKNFREFPKFAETLYDKKEKKIVMYCT